MTKGFDCEYPNCTGSHNVILYRYEKDTQERKQYCQPHFDRIRFSEMKLGDALRDINYRKGRKALFAKH